MADFGKARLAEMMCNQLWLSGGDSCELVAEHFAYSAVQHLPPTFKQILVSGILDQSMFEAVFRLRRYTLHKQDVSLGEPIQCCLKIKLVHPGHCT